MLSLTNPAGRLHYLLQRYDSNPDQSIINAWAYALEVEPQDVHLHLGSVGNLLRDAKRAARETDDDAWAPMEGHLTTLATCVFPTGVTWNDAVSHVRPDPAAMQMLAGLSSTLQARDEADGKVPTEDERDDLIGQVRELMEEVAAADLPPQIRRGLIDRLADMLEALEHVAVGGPDAIRKAAEALTLATIMLEDDLKAYQRIFRKATALGKAAIVTVGVMGGLSTSLVALDKVIDVPMIEQGRGEPVQLPAGPPVDDQATPPEH